MSKVEDLVEQAKSDICANYCKWPDKYTDQDQMLDEKCSFCPLVEIL